MDNIFAVFAPFLYFVTILIPYIVPGPIASLLFISYVKKKRLSILHLVMLFIADGLSLFIVNATYYLRSSDLAFCLAPLAIVASFGILHFSWKTLTRIGEEDLEFRKRIDIGVFLIIFLQVIIFVIVGSNATE